MSLYWRLTLRVFIIIWAGYTALAQPGLPPCWLEARACEIHPHFSKEHAESPHTHGYLFDLAKATASAALPILLIPVSLLIELLSLSPLLRRTGNPAVIEWNWISPLEPPPPRASITS
jgi:hypothetical protein